MMYGSVEDMVSRFGKVDIVRLSQLEDRATDVIDVSKVETALNDASAMIDSYLRGRYQVPVQTPPRDLIRAACILARYDLAKSSHSEPTDQMVKDYEEIRKWLLDIQKGVARLDIPVHGPTQSSVSNSGARFEDREAIFTSQNLRRS